MRCRAGTASTCREAPTAVRPQCRGDFPTGALMRGAVSCRDMQVTGQWGRGSEEHAPLLLPGADAAGGACGVGERGIDASEGRAAVALAAAHPPERDLGRRGQRACGRGRAWGGGEASAISHFPAGAISAIPPPSRCPTQIPRYIQISISAIYDARWLAPSALTCRQQSRQGGDADDGPDCHVSVCDVGRWR